MPKNPSKGTTVSRLSARSSPNDPKASKNVGRNGGQEPGGGQGPQSMSLSSSLNSPRAVLESFLNIPLAHFKASREASKSTSSRKPRYYDLHIHPDLQLRKIAIVEDLPEKVASLCDSFLDTGLLHIVPSSTFPFDKNFDKVKQVDSEADAIMNEHTLAMSYRIRFGRPLSAVSSTLLFETKAWGHVFDFTLSPKDVKDLNFAIPDGFLRVEQADEKTAAETGLTLTPQQRKDIELIKKHKLHHIAIWEFKNLFAGSKKTMNDIVALEGDFDWRTCDTSSQTNCESDPRHIINGRVSQTGRQIGFDSKIIPIIMDIIQNEEEAAAARQTARLESDAPMEIIDHQGQKHETVKETISSTSEKTFSKTKVFADKKVAATSHAASRRVPANKKIDKAKHSKKAQMLGGVISRGKNAELQKPRDVITQIWTEALKYDVTLFIINAGNFEIMCFLRRDTQTLYMSRVFAVEEGIYKRAQIGFQILAYEDALDRARQLEALEHTKDPIFPRSYYLKLDPNPYPPVHPNASGLSDTGVVNSESIYQNLLHDLRNKGKFRILLPRALFRKTRDVGLYTMKRSSNDPTPAEPSVSDWLLETGAKLSDKVYSVVATQEKNSFTDKLVIKIAKTNFEYESLRYEYKTHRSFQSEDFGVEVFGILQSPDLTWRGLLMMAAGRSLEDLRKKRRSRFAKENSENYVDAVKDLHSKDVLHGNLKPEHFLITEEGRVSLVSYKPTRFIYSSSNLDVGADKENGTEETTQDALIAREKYLRMENEVKLAKSLTEDIE